MLGALRASFFYRLGVGLQRRLAGLHAAPVGGSTSTARALAWVESSRSFSATMAVGSLVVRLQDGLRAAGDRSAVFGAGAGRTLPFSAWLSILDRWLVLVPFTYLFIDTLVRDIPPLAGFARIWDELALLALTVYLVARPLWLRTGYRLRWSALDWLVVVFIALGVSLMTGVAPDPAVALEGFRAVFQHMLWYFVVRQLVSKENRALVYRSIVFTGLFLGWHAVYQTVVGVAMPSSWVDHTESITTRAYSIIGSPNILGAVFVLTIPVVAVVMLGDETRWVKSLAALALPAMVLGLLFTYSRQAYLAIAGAVAIFLVLFYPRAIKYSIVALGVVLVTFKSVADRIFFLATPAYLARSASGGRVLRYAHALERWTEAPWLGQGLGRFGGAVATHHGLTPFYVDSYYLKTLVEMGAVGLVGLLGLYATILVKVKSLIHSQRRPADALAVSGVFVGLLGLVLQNAVENVFEVPMMIVFFFGLVAVALTYDEPQGESA